jgi:hypothetical protein
VKSLNHDKVADHVKRAYVAGSHSRVLKLTAEVITAVTEDYCRLGVTSISPIDV